MTINIDPPEKNIVNRINQFTHNQKFTMKYCKYYALMLLLLLHYADGIAQKAKPDPRWRFQIGAGAAINYFTNEQPHSGMNLGGVANVRLNYATSKNFSLFAETGYAGAGGSLTKFTDLSYLGFDPTITFKNVKQSSYLIHSLSSSIGMGYTFFTKQNWTIKLYAAPTLNITLGETEQYEKTGNLLTGVSNFPGIIATINGSQNVDKFKPYWWGVTTGLQVGLPIKKMQELYIDFRFSGGLTSVLDDYSYIGTKGVSGNIRTNSFQLGVGYSIPAFRKKSTTTTNK